MLTSFIVFKLVPPDYNFFFLVQINRYAFSGGQDSVENHRKYGANLEVLEIDVLATILR